MPAENVAGRIAPRGAVVFLVAGQVIEVKGRLVEDPVFALLLLDPEDIAEQVLGALAAQKMFGIRGPLIGIARRYGNPLDPESHREIEKLGGFFRGRVVKQGGIDGHPEAALYR